MHDAGHAAKSVCYIHISLSSWKVYEMPAASCDSQVDMSVAGKIHSLEKFKVGQERLHPLVQLSRQVAANM